MRRHYLYGGAGGLGHTSHGGSDAAHARAPGPRRSSFRGRPRGHGVHVAVPSGGTRRGTPSQRQPGPTALARTGRAPSGPVAPPLHWEAHLNAGVCFLFDVGFSFI